MPLSVSDMARISRATGKPWEDFAFADRVIGLSKGLHAGGYRFRLKVVYSDPSTRRCVFLGKGGCTLTIRDRPIGCRMYPYHYNGVERSLTISVASHVQPCLAVEEAESEEDLRKSLRTSAGELVLLGIKRSDETVAHAKLIGDRGGILK